MSGQIGVAHRQSFPDMTDDKIGPQLSYIYGHIKSVEETIRIKEVWKEGVIAEDERSLIFYLLSHQHLTQGSMVCVLSVFRSLCSCYTPRSP